MYTLIIEDKNGVIADEFSFDRGTYLIGRVEGNDIILPSSNVSRQHARLFVRDNRCYIEDLGSSNGVIVDGQRTNGERDLGSAAQIRIGDYYLYLEFSKDGTEEAQNVVSTHIVSQDANAFKLVRIGDAFAGEEFILGERQNTIGRTDDNYILLNDPSISRHHGRIDNDGLVYTMSDLGSSNGSKLNGKRLAAPTLLKEGDRVTFGNVEFVFVPSSQQVDPNNLGTIAKPSGGGGAGKTIVIIVAVLAVLCLLGSAISAAGYYLLNRTPEPVEVPKTELTVEQKVTQHVEAGRAKMQQTKWDEAIESFDRALALDPENADAKKFKQQSVKERLAKEQFEAGQDLMSKGQHESAKAKFEGIEEGTAAYDQAKDEIKSLDKILAATYKTQGIDSYKNNEFDIAYKTLGKSMDLVCDSEVAEYLDRCEKKMKALRRKYGKFDVYEVPDRCK